MIPIFQTRVTDPEQATHGNCFASCVASLLELPLSRVPQFEDMGQEWGGVLYEFLTQQGYVFQGTFYPGSQKRWWPALTQRSAGVDGFFIVQGESPRLHVIRGHSVIYRAGKIVHDPHPSGAGLKTVRSVLLIERIQHEHKRRRHRARRDQRHDKQNRSGGDVAP